MRKKTDITCPFYSISRIIKISFLIMIVSQSLTGKGLLSSFDPRFTPAFNISSGFSNPSVQSLQDTTNISDTTRTIYPGRPMLMSLILPGLGQYYVKSPLWKTALFAGIEVVAIAGYWKWTQDSEDIRKKYEKYALQHWNINNWITNTEELKIRINQELTAQDYHEVEDIVIDGTHHLFLYISDADIYVSSDTLANDPGFAFDYVLNDRDFFENIGKYDQFVAGWDDALDDFSIKFKDVGDSTEVIIMTPYKKKYLNLRADSNELLNRAKYAISAIMFNHVISAMETVWSSQNTSRKKKNVKTSLGLLYDRKSKYGIGGLAFFVDW